MMYWMGQGGLIRLLTQKLIKKMDYTNSSILLFHMNLLVLSASLLCGIYCELSATIGDTSFSIFSTTTMGLYQDPSSPYYPNDFYRAFQITNSSIYTLGSNNIVQVYDVSNPTQVTQNYTAYSFGSGQSYNFVSMSFSSGGDLMVLTSYASGTLIHMVHNISTTGIVFWNAMAQVHSFSTQPYLVFLKDQLIYSYFRQSSGNDKVHVTDINTNYTFTINLGVGNCKVAVTPDRTKALAWTQKSKVYIYEVASNFTLLNIFTGSEVNPKDKTDSISFSSDSQIALIQADNNSPVNILNLTDFSIIGSVTVHGTISSVSIIDPNNQYLLIRASSGNKIYDLETSTLVSVSGSIPGGTLTVNSQSSQVFVMETYSIECYGMNVTEGNKTIMSFVLPSSGSYNTSNTTNNTSNTTNNTSNTTYDAPNTTYDAPNTTYDAPNTTNDTSNTTYDASNTTYDASNTTNDTSNMTYDASNMTNDASNITNDTSNTTNDNSWQQAAQNQQQSLYRKLDYSAAYKETLAGISKPIQVINNAVQNTFSVIFSTPLAIYFMSLFNYFTLSSLYVFLNMPIPDIVFQKLSEVAKSCQADILTQLGVRLPIQLLSDEKADQPKAIYFGVSSDFYFYNCLNVIIIVGNVFFYEMLILFTGQVDILKKSSLYLKKQRLQIYFGLVLSNMVQFILPYKYIFQGSSDNFATKMNQAFFYLLVCFLLLLVLWSLFQQLDKVQPRQKHPVKRALRQWWTTYENFIYPLTIMLARSRYFMTVIGFSNWFAFYNAWFVVRSRRLTVLKALYPLLFHHCFVVFSLSDNHSVLIVTSIICLVIFVLGSAHHLIEAVCKLISGIYCTIKGFCKVQPINEKKPKSVGTASIMKKSGESSMFHKASTKKGVKFDQINSQNIESPASRIDPKSKITIAKLVREPKNKTNTTFNTPSRKVKTVKGINKKGDTSLVVRKNMQKINIQFSRIGSPQDDLK